MFQVTKPCEILLVNGHGVKEEFHLPELADELKGQYPYGSKLSPSELASFLKIKTRCVISTVCSTGTDDMVNAFLAGVAKYYIAPTGNPEGN